MKIEEITIGDRVLLQSSLAVKEHATVKAILKNGNVLLKISDGSIDDYDPQFILKKFGQQ